MNKKSRNAGFLASYGLISQLPPSVTTEIAFIGKSNVGKSSLINKLLGRKSLARVSNAPGKTATINFYECYGGILADLPGYGYAKMSQTGRARLAALIDGYLAAEREIALVVLLLDFRHKLSERDAAMIDALIAGEVPFLIALTKSDKLTKTERAAARTALRGQLPPCEGLTIIETSTVTGEGIDELKSIIEELMSDEADE